MDDTNMELVAVQVSEMEMTLRPAPRSRPWMEAADARFAKRCLPMMMANQWGWELLNPSAFCATWDGAPNLEAIRIEPHTPEAQPPAISHFGLGILTWHIPYLFRCPPGYNLWVRGPANMPKDAIAALEGVVETDWSPSTFTMNWKFTRSGQSVTFEAGEPIAMVVPIRRGELECFRPSIVDSSCRPQDRDAYLRWSESRRQFLNDLRNQEPNAVRLGWERSYTVGRDADGKAFEGHQTHLSLSPFADHRSTSVRR
jgi:hypothetical protein